MPVVPTTQSDGTTEHPKTAISALSCCDRHARKAARHTHRHRHSPLPCMTALGGSHPTEDAGCGAHLCCCCAALRCRLLCCCHLSLPLHVQQLGHYAHKGLNRCIASHLALLGPTATRPWLLGRALGGVLLGAFGAGAACVRWLLLCCFQEGCWADAEVLLQQLRDCII